MPTPADLFLSPDLSESDAVALLARLGFREPSAADAALQALADDPVVRETLGRIADPLLSALAEAPDPDAAVRGLSRYVGCRSGRAMFFDYLGDDPRALDVLAIVFGASPLLTDVLVRHPDYFHWLVAQVERSAPDRQDLEEELDALLAGSADHASTLETLKRWKRREILRVGTRELLGRDPVPGAAAQLADVAGAVVTRALRAVVRIVEQEQGADLPGRFAILGGGSLGGGELSYGSALDLMFVFEPGRDGVDGAPARDRFVRLAAALTAALRDEAAEDRLYQVNVEADDRGVPLVESPSECEIRYGAAHADPMEQAAWVKVRPVSGDAGLGAQAVARLHAAIFAGGARTAERLTRQGQRQAAMESAPWHDLPRATAGVRQIELTTLALQLAHGAGDPAVRKANTLAALEALSRSGLLSDARRRALGAEYELLCGLARRLELVHDVAAGGTEPRDLAARRMGRESWSRVDGEIAECCERVDRLCREIAGD